MTHTIQSYKDLIAWQLATDLSLRIYRATSAFPSDERFGLTSQLRRAAVSVPSNIAEGYGRGSTQDYLRFLKVARGSLYEIGTQLHIAHELGLIGHEVFNELSNTIQECGRTLAGLIRSIG